MSNYSFFFKLLLGTKECIWGYLTPYITKAADALLYQCLRVRDLAVWILSGDGLQTKDHCPDKTDSSHVAEFGRIPSCEKVEFWKASAWKCIKRIE